MLAPMGSDAADVQDEPMLVGLLEAFLLAEPIASGPDEAAADEARVLLVQLSPSPTPPASTAPR